MADKMSIDNKPNRTDRDETDDSVGSNSEREQHSTVPANNPSGQDVQQPKRKGGRKPIYATSEERKQRNRQAQAAFRERRTEYIKQLEDTIRVHESNLQSLQTAHRTAADECLMLRYKNSLLERILLEKGIDVSAELRAKTGSPNLGPTHMPQNLVQPPPLQRPIMNRNHARRSNSSIAPKAEPGASNLQTSLQHHRSGSSTNHRQNSTSSNNTGSALSPTTSDGLSMRGSATGLRQQIPLASGAQQSRQGHLSAGFAGRNAAGDSSAGFYPATTFHNHLDALEQDYDAQADMVDDSEIDASNGPGAFSTTFGDESSQPMLLPASSNNTGHQSHEPAMTNQHFPSMTQLLDQNLDWDPFGLSASMAFPTQQFQFDQPNMR